MKPGMKVSVRLFATLAWFATALSAISQDGVSHVRPVAIADAVLPGSGGSVYSSYLVTSAVNLLDSSGQYQRVFVDVDINVGQLNTDRYKLVLSSSSDANTPYAVDDALFINGQKVVCGLPNEEVGNSPRSYIGRDPATCYQANPAVDLTAYLRRDGHVFIQCIDMGGSVFGCSALYLRVVPK